MTCRGHLWVGIAESFEEVISNRFLALAESARNSPLMIKQLHRDLEHRNGNRFGRWLRALQRSPPGRLLQSLHKAFKRIWQILFVGLH